MFQLIKQESNFQPKPWMEDYEFILVTEEEQLKQVVEECMSVDVYALDLETTGLDTRIFPRGDVLKTNIDIVGVCLCAHPKRGYYIPLRHHPNGEPSEHNMSWSVFETHFRRLMESDARPVVHNCKFEGEILTYTGGEPLGDWDNPKKWEDTQILVYLDDSTRNTFGLKPSSKNLLGKEQIELSELFPEGTEDLDYSLLDPSAPGVAEYAASDAICTLEIYLLLKDKALALTSKAQNGKPHSQKDVYAIEKLCVPAIRWMERCRVHIDLDKTASLMHMARKELVESLKDFYEGASDMLGRDITPLSFYLFLESDMDLEVDKEDPHAPTLQDHFNDYKNEAKHLYSMYSKGDFGLLQSLEDKPKLKEMLSREAPPAKDGIDLQVEYDILSSQQLGVLLHDMGIPKLQRTATGQIKTAADVLKKIIDKYEREMPFVRKIKMVRGNAQALKNLTNIWKDTDRRDNSLLIQFRAYAAATGRFSSRGDKRPHLTGGTRFNLQSMPSGKDPEAAESLLRIRECISAHEGFVLVAIDYSGQELRVSANLTNEPLWIEQFFKCSTCDMKFSQDSEEPPPSLCPRCGSDRIGDIHTLTGIQLFGEEATKDPKAWKKKRNDAKSTNFALNYGGGPSAIQRQVGVSKNEARRIVKKFKGSYRYVKAWWSSVEKFAKKHHYILTPFQRKFPLPDITHPERWVRNKALRNAKNSPIQGAGADITKIAMGFIYLTCKKKGWVDHKCHEDKVRMVLTMHDELVFEIHEDILEEAIDTLCEMMTRNPFIKSRKWKVPLTVDVEMGRNWTVPYNLREIEYRVDIRQKLQNPDLSKEEILAQLRRLDGVYGGPERVKKKMDSFEEIRWPDFLAPHFESGQRDLENPLTPEEKDALQKAWSIYFGGEEALDVDVKTTAEIELEEDPPPQKTHHFVVSDLSVEAAMEVAEIIHNSPGEFNLVLVGPEGDILPVEAMVDPEGFDRLAEERGLK